MLTKHLEGFELKHVLCWSFFYLLHLNANFLLRFFFVKLTSAMKASSSSWTWAFTPLNLSRVSIWPRHSFRCSARPKTRRTSTTATWSSTRTPVQQNRKLLKTNQPQSGTRTQSSRTTAWMWSSRHFWPVDEEAVTHQSRRTGPRHGLVCWRAGVAWTDTSASRWRTWAAPLRTAADVCVQLDTSFSEPRSGRWHRTVLPPTRHNTPLQTQRHTRTIRLWDYFRQKLATNQPNPLQTEFTSVCVKCNCVKRCVLTSREL